MPLETALIWGGAAAVGTYLLVRPRWAIPVRGDTVVTSGFLSSRSTSLGTGHHGGMDFRGERKQAIVAAYSGEVLKVDRTSDNSAGLYVVLKHTVKDLGPVITRYMHMDFIAPGLAAGQRVGRGAWLGGMGDSGASSVHLHFDVQACSDAAVARYKAKYGPVPEGVVLFRWSLGGSQCVPVPAEPLLPPVAYLATPLAQAREAGIAPRVA